MTFRGSSGLVVAPPARISAFLRPALFVAEKIAGKEALPARLLAHFPKGAVGAGLFEATAANGADMEKPDGPRVLAVARIAASLAAGCPFCVDMNAATWKRAGLTPEELHALLANDRATVATFDDRARTAARYAEVLSATPVVLDDALVADVRRWFSPREIVILATTIAQVNYWSRFSQGLGIPPAGFFDQEACPAPRAGRSPAPP